MFDRPSNFSIPEARSQNEQDWEKASTVIGDPEFFKRVRNAVKLCNALDIVASEASAT